MKHPDKIDRLNGFTLIEVVVVIAIMAILASIAVPNFSSWLPDARLKTAARDLFSNLQLTRMEAVKTNTGYTLEFDTAAETYQMVDASGNVKKTVSLSDYGSGVRFGSSATAPVDSRPIDDFITYDGNKGEFDARGTGKDGYIYVTNDKGTSYAVGSRAVGAIEVRKWDGANWR